MGYWMQVTLVMFKSDSSRREFPVKAAGFVIGRKNTCDLRIPLTSVSRQHCELRVEDGRVKLRDVGSSNGTFHNSIRVQEAVLEAGDELVVGPVVFTVVIDGKPEVIKPVRSLVDSPASLDDSVILPSELLEEASELDPDSASDTISSHDDEAGGEDGGEDPIAALERLTELELPDTDG
jgi:pSer/pThr/pTyr-binding forkhead associated (FHA) protein